MRSTMPTASPHMYTRTYTRLQVLIILFGVIITCLFQAANRVSWDNQTYSYHIRLLVCNPFVLLTFIVAVVWTWRIVCVCLRLFMCNVCYLPIMSITDIIYMYTCVRVRVCVCVCVHIVK